MFHSTSSNPSRHSRVLLALALSIAVAAVASASAAETSSLCNKDTVKNRLTQFAEECLEARSSCTSNMMSEFEHNDFVFCPVPGKNRDHRETLLSIAIRCGRDDVIEKLLANAVAVKTPAYITYALGESVSVSAKSDEEKQKQARLIQQLVPLSDLYTSDDIVLRFYQEFEKVISASTDVMVSLTTALELLQGDNRHKLGLDASFIILRELLLKDHIQFEKVAIKSSTWDFQTFLQMLIMKKSQLAVDQILRLNNWSPNLETLKLMFQYWNKEVFGAVVLHKKDAVCTHLAPLLALAIEKNQIDADSMEKLLTCQDAVNIVCGDLASAETSPLIAALDKRASNPVLIKLLSPKDPTTFETPLHRYVRNSTPSDRHKLTTSNLAPLLDAGILAGGCSLTEQKDTKSIWDGWNRMLGSVSAKSIQNMKVKVWARCDINDDKTGPLLPSLLHGFTKIPHIGAIKALLDNPFLKHRLSSSATLRFAILELAVENFTKDVFHIIFDRFDEFHFSDYADDKNKTLLHVAVEKNKDDALKMLTKRLNQAQLSDLLLKIPEGGKTAFQTAIDKSKPDNAVEIIMCSKEEAPFLSDEDIKAFVESIHQWKFDAPGRLVEWAIAEDRSKLVERLLQLRNAGSLWYEPYVSGRFIKQDEDDVLSSDMLKAMLTPLRSAVKANDADEVKRMAKSLAPKQIRLFFEVDSDLESMQTKAVVALLTEAKVLTDPVGKYAFEQILQHGSFEVFKGMLELNADDLALFYELLHLAISLEDKTDVVSYLLDDCYLSTAELVNSRDAMQAAIDDGRSSNTIELVRDRYQGEVERDRYQGEVKLPLNSGATSGDIHRKNPLHRVAAEAGEAALGVLKLFLSFPNAHDALHDLSAEKMTPLQIAIVNKNGKAANEIVEKFPVILTREALEDQTLMLLVLRHFNQDSFKAVMKAKSLIDVSSKINVDGERSQSLIDVAIDEFEIDAPSMKELLTCENGVKTLLGDFETDSPAPIIRAFVRSAAFNREVLEVLMTTKDPVTDESAQHRALPSEIEEKLPELQLKHLHLHSHDRCTDADRTNAGNLIKYVTRSGVVGTISGFVKRTSGSVEDDLKNKVWARCFGNNDYSKVTPIHEAMRSGSDANAINYLLSNEFVARFLKDIDFVENPIKNQDKTLLQVAVKNQKVLATQSLLANDKYATEKDKQVMNLAITNYRKDVFDALAAKKDRLDLSFEDDEGRNLFHIASRESTAEPLKALIALVQERPHPIESLAAFMKKVSNSNHTPLQMAFENENREAVEVLIGHSEDADIKDVFSKGDLSRDLVVALASKYKDDADSQLSSLLHSAIEWKRDEAVRHLLSEFKELLKLDTEIAGRNAIHLAAEHLSSDTIEFMLDNARLTDQSLELRDLIEKKCLDRNSLYIAAERGNAGVLETLLTQSPEILSKAKKDAALMKLIHEKLGVCSDGDVEKVNTLFRTMLSWKAFGRNLGPDDLTAITSKAWARCLTVQERARTTLLQKAISNQDLKAVKALFENIFVNVNIVDDRGCRLLQLAPHHHHQDTHLERVHVPIISPDIVRALTEHIHDDNQGILEVVSNMIDSDGMPWSDQHLNAVLQKDGKTCHIDISSKLLPTSDKNVIHLAVEKQVDSAVMRALLTCKNAVNTVCGGNDGISKGCPLLKARDTLRDYACFAELLKTKDPNTDETSLHRLLKLGMSVADDFQGEFDGQQDLLTTCTPDEVASARGASTKFDNDFEAVLMLVKKRVWARCSISKPTDERETLLHVAIKKQNVLITKSLLQNSYVRTDGRAINLAVAHYKRGVFDALAALSIDRIDVSFRDQDGRNLLHVATQGSTTNMPLEALISLIQRVIGPDGLRQMMQAKSTFDDGKTPLEEAAFRYKNVKAVEVLIGHSDDADIKEVFSKGDLNRDLVVALASKYKDDADSQLSSLLHSAIKWKRDEAVRHLLSEFKEVLKLDTEIAGRSAIHLAAEHLSSDTIKFMLSNALPEPERQRVIEKKCLDKNALDIAAERGDAGVLEMIFTQSPDVLSKAKKNVALMKLIHEKLGVCSDGDVEKVNTLFKTMLSWKILDSERRNLVPDDLTAVKSKAWARCWTIQEGVRTTLLRKAITNEDLKAVKALFENIFVNVNAIDGDGRNILHLAVDHAKSLQLLLNELLLDETVLSVLLATLSSKGRTPLQEAVFQKKADSIQMLLPHHQQEEIMHFFRKGYTEELVSPDFAALLTRPFRERDDDGPILELISTMLKKSESGKAWTEKHFISVLHHNDHCTVDMNTEAGKKVLTLAVDESVAASWVKALLTCRNPVDAVMEHAFAYANQKGSDIEVLAVMLNAQDWITGERAIYRYRDDERLDDLSPALREMFASSLEGCSKDDENTAVRIFGVFSAGGLWVNKLNEDQLTDLKTKRWAACEIPGRESKGKPMIQIATELGKTEVFEALLENPFVTKAIEAGDEAMANQDANADDRKAIGVESLLKLAIEHQKKEVHITIVERLLGMLPDPLITPPFEFVRLAIQNYEHEAGVFVPVLTKFGIKADQGYRSLLHLAVQKGHPVPLSLLIQNAADHLPAMMKEKNEEGRTPFIAALVLSQPLATVFMGDSEDAALLLLSAEEINAFVALQWKFPVSTRMMHWAIIEKKHTELVKKFLTLTNAGPALLETFKHADFTFEKLREHEDLVGALIRFKFADNVGTLLHIAGAQDDGIVASKITASSAFLLEFRNNIFVQNVDGDTPFHLAARNQRHELMKHLLRFYDAPNALKLVSNAGLSALHIAVNNRDLEMIQELVRPASLGDRKAASTLLRSGKMEAPLNLVVREFGDDSVDIVKALLKCRNVVEASPFVLHLALRRSTPLMFNALAASEVLRLGLNLGLQEEASKKSTPLHLAARGDSLEVLKALLQFEQAPAAMFVRDTPQERTPLHIAIEREADAVEFSLELLGMSDASGRTYLHHAVENNDFELVEKLFERLNGRQIQLRVNHDMMTPLHLAADIDHKENAFRMFKLLLQASNADAMLKPIAAKSRTIVHIAAEKGHVQVLKMDRVKTSFDSYAFNAIGQNPIHVANGVETLRELLTFKDADRMMGETDDNGRSPLEVFVLQQRDQAMLFELANAIRVTFPPDRRIGAAESLLSSLQGPIVDELCQAIFFGGQDILKDDEPWLHLAASGSMIHVLPWLIRQQNQVNSADFQSTLNRRLQIAPTENNGPAKTPLEYALEKQNHACLALLVDAIDLRKAEFPINQKDTNGKSLLRVLFESIDDNKFVAQPGTDGSLQLSIYQRILQRYFARFTSGSEPMNANDSPEQALLRLITEPLSRKLDIEDDQHFILVDCKDGPARQRFQHYYQTHRGSAELPVSDQSQNQNPPLNSEAPQQHLRRLPCEVTIRRFFNEHSNAKLALQIAGVVFGVLALIVVVMALTMKSLPEDRDLPDATGAGYLAVVPEVTPAVPAPAETSPAIEGALNDVDEEAGSSDHWNARYMFLLIPAVFMLIPVSLGIYLCRSRYDRKF